MTLANIGHLIHWPGIATLVTAAPALQTVSTLDAAGEYYALVFQAREAMVISHVGWKPGVVAGSPTADIRIETVGAADGLSTGTLWATNTNVVTGTIVSNTWELNALTAPATIAKGEMFCVKIVYASGTSIIVQAGLGPYQTIISPPYAETNTSGSVVKVRNTYPNLLALGSSATAFYTVANCLPANAFTNGSFNNTTFFAKGMRFQVPFKCRIAGLAWYNSSKTGDFAAVLYDDAGAEISSSSTAIDGTWSTNGTNSGVAALFDNAVTLEANTWYRAALVPNSATDVGIYYGTCPSVDYVSGLWGKEFWQYCTQATGPGAWTDNAAQFPIMDILIDQLGDDAGGGGVVARVIGG